MDGERFRIKVLSREQTASLKWVLYYHPDKDIVDYYCILEGAYAKKELIGIVLQELSKIPDYGWLYMESVTEEMIYELGAFIGTDFY